MNIEFRLGLFLLILGLSLLIFMAKAYMSPFYIGGI